MHEVPPSIGVWGLGKDVEAEEIGSWWCEVAENQFSKINEGFKDP